MARKTNIGKEIVFGEEIKKKETYYLGNPALPAADSQYEWTPKMISALERCKTDICYFAETFFTIVDKTKRHVIKLHDYQKRILKSLSTNNRLILNCNRQCRQMFCTRQSGNLAPQMVALYKHKAKSINAL